MPLLSSLEKRSVPGHAPDPCAGRTGAPSSVTSMLETPLKAADSIDVVPNDCGAGRKA